MSPTAIFRSWLEVLEEVYQVDSSLTANRTDVQVWEVTMRVSNKESDLVRACLDWLALHRIKAWRMNNTGIYDPVKKIHRRFHGLRGVSDILGILPLPQRQEDGSERYYGVFLAVEVKKPGEKPRQEQTEFLQDIEAAGGIGVCVHSLRELEEQLEPFLGNRGRRTAG